MNFKIDKEGLWIIIIQSSILLLGLAIGFVIGFIFGSNSLDKLSPRMQGA
ncbi:MAG: hypothetical protein V1660_01995 [archaeon]